MRNEVMGVGDGDGVELLVVDVVLVVGRARTAEGRRSAAREKRMLFLVRLGCLFLIVCGVPTAKFSRVYTRRSKVALTRSDALYTSTGEDMRTSKACHLTNQGTNPVHLCAQPLQGSPAPTLVEAPLSAATRHLDIVHSPRSMSPFPLSLDHPPSVPQLTLMPRWAEELTKDVGASQGPTTGRLVM